MRRPFKKYDRVLYNGDICYVVTDEEDGAFRIEWEHGWVDDGNIPADYIPILNAHYWWISPQELEPAPLRERMDYRKFIKSR